MEGAWGVHVRVRWRARDCEARAGADGVCLCMCLCARLCARMCECVAVARRLRLAAQLSGQ